MYEQAHQNDKLTSPFKTQSEETFEISENFKGKQIFYFVIKQ